MRRIVLSDFCNGKNDRGWKANFDFLLRPNTHIKAMEGAYDNREGSKKEESFLEFVEKSKESKGGFTTF